MKHTDNYYINKIKKYLHLVNNGNDIYIYNSRYTPTDRGVRIEHIDKETHKTSIIREEKSRERLYNEVKYYKDSGYLI